MNTAWAPSRLAATSQRKAAFLNTLRRVREPGTALYLTRMPLRTLAHWRKHDATFKAAYVAAKEGK